MASISGPAGAMRRRERGAMRPRRLVTSRAPDDLRFREHYTDTAAAADHIFSLCWLLGPSVIV
jgi:hypothetical protein